MKNTRNILFGVLLAGLWTSPGCATDGLWRGESAQGPTTDRNAPGHLDLPEIRIADTREVDLVEAVLSHRAMYSRNLKLLHDYYRDRGYEQKRRWTETEMAGVKRVQPFKYLLSAEIPAKDLRPVESVAEADTLYERGLALMKEGGHGMPVVYREDLMLEALGVFVDLIQRYPGSDKIDDAAFYCGEIHKEYLKNQEPIAVKWYERAYTWDPDTPHNARFQAAVTYDFRLHDRARALELYRQVIDRENRDKSNVAFATHRIHYFTSAMAEDTPEATPEPQEMFGARTPK
ncbi:MAG: hypothetical protein GY778_31715 [bacterium]|nr:hypothetical protein [bacterium]